MAVRSKAPLPTAVAETAAPAVPWADMTKGERMAYNADLALNFARQLLELPFDPRNLKMLGLQKDAALTIISQQIRVESEQLREPRARGQSVREFYQRYEDGEGSS
jgi:hypothetical protein